MAFFEKRGTKTRAVVNSKALKKRKSKTFDTELEAREWAKGIEAEITLNIHTDMGDSKNLMFTALLTQYKDEVTVGKTDTTRDVEGGRIDSLVNRLDGYMLADIDSTMVSGYIRHRMSKDKVCWDTVSKEIQIIGYVLEAASIAWKHSVHASAVKDGIKLFDVTSKSLKRKPVCRDRTLTDDEFDLIKARGCKHSLVAQFAIETAMRRSEICRIRIEDLNTETQVLSIPVSKNDHNQAFAGRKIGISKRALAILNEAANGRTHGSLFQLDTPEKLTRGWQWIRGQLGIEDLRFHDFRHEATTRLFAKGLSIDQVASITGHTNWKMLSRYTHQKPKSLVALLD